MLSTQILCFYFRQGFYLLSNAQSITNEKNCTQRVGWQEDTEASTRGYVLLDLPDKNNWVTELSKQVSSHCL